MRRFVIAVLFYAFVSGGTLSAQGNKPVKSITLDQLIGKNSTADQGSSGHIGAIGSVLERVELKGSSLAQDRISTPYRRYVMNGTMDLGGKTINMPDGCILDLENGSLKNGTLKMNSTLVTPVYGISKERNTSKVKIEGDYYETLVDLWGERAEPLFPWDTAAPKKVYIVDLKKFGITPGYQKRGSDGHYSDRQYDLMYNNGIGFTKAIRWAYDNGFDGIRFPKNDYCFSPRTTRNEKPATGPIVLIQNLDKFDIDFGGASCYLILDSKRKSKYFTLSPDKPYSQGGTMFFVAACINLQIHDGRMVGDRKLRDYEEGAERNLENSRAISVSAYCQNIRLHHLDICEFMADGISAGQFGRWYPDYESRHYTPKMSTPGKASLCKYVLKNGRVVKDPTNFEHCTVSNYLKLTNHYHKDFEVIRTIASKRRFTVNNNLGYTRLINNYHNVEILTFDEKVSTEQPLRIIRTSYLDDFELLPNETGVKIQSWYDEGASANGIQHSGTVSDLISSHLIVENCNIHDNHRGGISGGCNYMTIRNCRFSKNDSDKNHSGKTIPLFLVGATNYHINFEDSYAKGLEIYDCTFSRTNTSIGRLLFGVLTLSFHDNVSDAGVVIYNNILSDIYRNSVSSAGLGLADWRHTVNNDILHDYGFLYSSRVILFHDNKVDRIGTFKDHYRTFVWKYGNSAR